MPGDSSSVPGTPSMRSSLIPRRPSKPPDPACCIPRSSIARSPTGFPPEAFCNSGCPRRIPLWFPRSQRHWARHSRRFAVSGRPRNTVIIFWPASHPSRSVPPPSLPRVFLLPRGGIFWSGDRRRTSKQSFRTVSYTHLSASSFPTSFRSFTLRSPSLISISSAEAASFLTISRTSAPHSSNASSLYLPGRIPWKR